MMKQKHVLFGKSLKTFLPGNKTILIGRLVNLKYNDGNNIFKLFLGYCEQVGYHENEH